jgi:hypothetical protein
MATRSKTSGTRASRRTAPPPQAHAPRRPPINAMTPHELRTWITATRTALERKMARERAYLDRRAARGTYAPTDQAYEADQLLEVDLLAMLDEFEQYVTDMEP